MREEVHGPAIIERRSNFDLGFYPAEFPCMDQNLHNLLLQIFRVGASQVPEAKKVNSFKEIDSNSTLVILGDYQGRPSFRSMRGLTLASAPRQIPRRGIISRKSRDIEMALGVHTQVATCGEYMGIAPPEDAIIFNGFIPLVFGRAINVRQSDISEGLVYNLPAYNGEPVIF